MKQSAIRRQANLQHLDLKNGGKEAYSSDRTREPYLATSPQVGQGDEELLGDSASVEAQMQPSNQNDPTSANYSSEQTLVLSQ